MAEDVRHFLDGNPAPGIEYEHKTMKELVPQLPLQMINQTIAQLPPTNRAISEKSVFPFLRSTRTADA